MVASDIFAEGGIASSTFSMTYGMLTIHGIPKASYHAFRFLRDLTGDQLPLTITNAPVAAGALITVSGTQVRGLLWNQRLLEDASPATWLETLRIPVRTPGAYEVLTARVKPGAGSCYETWLDMGRPHNLSASEEALLRAHATPEWRHQRITATADHVVWNERLEPGEILFVEVRPVDGAALPRTVDATSLAAWDVIMGAKSR